MVYVYNFKILQIQLLLVLKSDKGDEFLEDTEKLIKRYKKCPKKFI
jgi:hypothetical protein